MVTEMITGRQTLDSIEKALQQVSKTVDRLNAELSQTNADKAKLVAKRLEAFQTLAKFRTELALVDGVIDDADRLSAQVRTILQARHKTLTGLKQREAEAARERTRTLNEQKKLHQEIERLEDELDAVGAQAKKELSSDPAYKARADRHAELQGMVEQAAAKAEKSRAEEEEKGAPYRNDPLFTYLWERKFGTSDYDHKGIIRALDGWVARLIGYQDARSNFAVLTQIPQRLTAHVARLREAALAERDALDTIEAEKISAMAGEDLIAKLSEAHRRREDQIAELERLNSEFSETGTQLKTYAEGQDTSFKDAVEKTTHFLESQDLNALRRDARETPGVDDDEVVGLIEKLARDRDGLEGLARSKREALDAAFKRKEELLRIAADFRRSRYDRPGSVFEPASNGEALLKMLLEGAITAVEYWARTQSGQRWRDRPGDSYRRRESGSFGGGSRRNSRSRSRGPDFRTGGGF
jgi:chromosome segregation ATPase